MGARQVSMVAGGIGAVVLFVYGLVQFSNPGPGWENPLRGFLGLGLACIALSASALAGALRDLAD
jgi:hypothetical protein